LFLSRWEAEAGRRYKVMAEGSQVLLPDLDVFSF
jgi:hypothetical protein